MKFKGLLYTELLTLRKSLPNSILKEILKIRATAFTLGFCFSTQIHYDEDLMK